MEQWRLPRLISNGMILQQKQECRIWGWDSPGRKVTVSFRGKEYETFVDESGRWLVCLREHTSGGPYVMNIFDDAGNESVIENILVGDVWFCSGQSNMELPMERVKDAYPEEIENCNNPFIRTFKIIENTNYKEPLEELLSGEWKEAERETICSFSATAYFFAKALYQMTGVPVGIIDASLGGSPIEGWSGRDMLEGYDELLALADRYADEEFVEGQKLTNQQQADRWHGQLDQSDIGLKECWEQEGADWETGCAVTLPFFFRDTKLKGFIGAVWFKREFFVTGEMTKQDTKLWLGTIVDSDTVYVNGVEVGHTEYQYPPRKYVIPKEVLRVGNNSIVIRVKCDKGKGRFTIGKKYALWNDYGEVNLEGVWKYRIGATCEECPDTDFISWKPTGLYNGMTAPCHKYNIAGVLWYQGESNAGDPITYKDLFLRMVNGYRKKWNNESLPVYYVQLPNFTIDMERTEPDIVGREWALMREVQRQSLEIPNTGMVTTIDLGEDNDLHPLNKKDIGYRLALWAASHLYGMDVEYSGPIAVQAKLETAESGCKIRILCSHADGGMYSFNAEKGNDIKDFELIDSAGKVYCAKATINIEEILVSNEEIQEPVAVRYCYKDTASAGIIYNKAGLPMSPFVMDIARENYEK